MLGTGLLLANVPGGVVEAFPAKWGVQMRAAALATIFLRCGLELEFKVGALLVELFGMVLLVALEVLGYRFVWVAVYGFARHIGKCTCWRAERQGIVMGLI
jgi:hypothetical protein